MARHQKTSLRSEIYACASCDLKFLMPGKGQISDTVPLDLAIDDLCTGSCASYGCDVCFGSKADIEERPSDVRFTPESGHSSAGAARAQGDHKRSKIGRAVAQAAFSLLLSSAGVLSERNRTFRNRSASAIVCQRDLSC